MINLDVVSEVMIGVLDSLETERGLVEDEGHLRATAAADEWLASLPDDAREASLVEGEALWQILMWAAQKED